MWTETWTQNPLLVALPLGLGILTAVGIGLIWQMSRGLKLNLYLVHQEEGTTDRAHRSVTPLTAPHRRDSLWKVLRQRRWREDQTLELGDYSGHFFKLRIGYSLLRHYSLTVESKGIRINGKKLEDGTRIFLSSGDRLMTGDRKFEILLSREQLESRFERELSLVA